MTLFRTGRPWCIAAPAAPSHPRCSTASYSEECEVESSADSKALEPASPGSTAVVPEPPSPLRSTSSAGRRRGSRLRWSPHTLESEALWANHDASNRRPRVFHRPANLRIYERSTASMGFLLLPEDALAPPGAPLRPAPACPSKPEVFRGFIPVWARDSVALVLRPFRVTGLSKSHLLGQLSRR